jgi:hypothetical protein
MARGNPIVHAPIIHARPNRPRTPRFGASGGRAVPAPNSVQTSRRARGEGAGAGRIRARKQRPANPLGANCPGLAVAYEVPSAIGGGPPQPAWTAGAHDPGGPTLAASPRRGALQAQQRRHPRRVTPRPCLIYRAPRRTGRATTSGSMGRAAMDWHMVGVGAPLVGDQLIPHVFAQMIRRFPWGTTAAAAAGYPGTTVGLLRPRRRPGDLHSAGPRPSDWMSSVVAGQPAECAPIPGHTGWHPPRSTAMWPEAAAAAPACSCLVDRSIQRSSSRPVVDRERRPIVRSYVITQGTFLIGSLGNYLIADTTVARNLRGREQCDLPAPHLRPRASQTSPPWSPG